MGGCLNRMGLQSAGYRTPPTIDGIPREILHYKRKGRQDLPLFLEEYEDKPTNLPGEPDNFLHDFTSSVFSLAPELIGFSPRFKLHHEVELPLCDEAQMLLYGRKRRWPLTVVDNIFYDQQNLRLLGVVTQGAPEVVRREFEGLDRAVSFFYYNFGIKPESYLFIARRNNLKPRRLRGPNLDPRFRGVFS